MQHRAAFAAHTHVSHFCLFMPATERRKVVLVGDTNCGKASLLSVFVKGRFPEVSNGMAFEDCQASLDVGTEEVQLTLWNTSGHENYQHLRSISYVDADVFVICFSIDEHSSLESATEKWAKEVRKNSLQVPLILVGMKSDLRDNMEGKPVPVLVSEAEGKNAASSIGAFAYIECSARLCQQVREVFELAVLAANSRQRGQRSIHPRYH
uniref:Transforming protein RhoA n=1 Tax=Schistocephalus solidus TaxID=70667 RepID=A0A0V0J6U9_SCHSO